MSGAPPPVAATSAAAQAAQAVFDDPAFWWKHLAAAPESEPWPIWKYLKEALSWCWNRVLDLLRPLWHLLRDLLKHLFGLAPDASMKDVHQWVVIALVSGLLVLAFLGRKELRRWLGGSAAKRGGLPVGLEATALADSALLFEQASAALAHGENVAAVRFAFLAAIAGLQDGGLLGAGRARTNREQVAELVRSPEVCARFGDLIVPFERTFYGERPISSDEAVSFVSRCRALAGLEQVA